MSATTIYANNDVAIEIERVANDSCEAKVNVNGENLIWISLEEKDEFVKELNDLLNKYRI